MRVRVFLCKNGFYSSDHRPPGETDAGHYQPGCCPIRSDSKLYTTQVGCAGLFSHMSKCVWISRATSTSDCGDATCAVSSGKGWGGLSKRGSSLSYEARKWKKNSGGGELKAIWVYDEAKNHFPSICFQLSSSPPCLGEERTLARIWRCTFYHSWNMCKLTGWWSCVTPHDDAADKRKWGSVAVVMATTVITGSCSIEQWSEPPRDVFFVSFHCCGLRFPLRIWISSPGLHSPLSFSIFERRSTDRDWGRRSLVHRFIISGTGYLGESGCSQRLHRHLEQCYSHARSFSITGTCVKRVD